MKRCKTHGDCPGGAAPVGKKGGYDRGEDHAEDEDGGNFNDDLYI